MGRNPLVRRLFPSRQVRRQRHTFLGLEPLEERSLLSLVAAYGFNEGSGTTLTDLSGNGNNGTISGATWTTSGKYGGALSFNGTSSTVTIKNSPSLDLTTGMTLEAWVNPTTVSSAWRDVIYKGNDNYFLEATSANKKLPGAGGTFGGANVATYGTSALATNTWTYLTETYDGATLRLYVNGVQVSSMAQTGNILTSTNALQIGGDSNYGQYFKGLIDNVRIYNTALTPSQIQTDMNTPVSRSTTPSVTSETPASAASGVAVSSPIAATFNEAVQSNTIGFTLKNGSNPVATTFSYNSSTNTATWTYSTPLAYGTNYTATISGAKSTSGVTMTAPFSWSFTTDAAPPSVTSKTPASGATGVAVSTAPTATFNEAVQASTISFTLKNGSNTVATTFSYNSSTNTATWTHSTPLAYGATYTATVSGAKDSAGDPMTSAVSWSFTTAAAVTPTVTSETPVSGASGVAVSSPISATFNEAVQSSTIGLTLENGSNTVATTFSYNSSTNTATWTPSAALAYGTTYTATISGAQSSSGTAMTAPFTWSFTTAAQSTSTGDPTTLASSLGPPPSPGPNVIWVSNQAALQTAFSNLQSGQTIVIEPGTYNLSSTLYIGLNSNITNVTVRGSTDNFNDVTLLGNGMDNSSYGNVPMGISIWNAQNVTIADLSIGDVYYDPIEVKGDAGASSVTIYHVHLFDAGEQFIKADPPSSGVGASNSTVEYSMIDYTNGPPVTDHGGGIGYTNGIDIHDGSNWLIAHNLIENLHTPDSDPAANLWNPAILIWNHSSNVTVDGNTIINCDRAIAFGLGPPSNGGDANDGGIIRNNFIYQAPGLFSATRAAGSDGQIIAWDSPDSTQILFNTILTNGNSTDSIQLRYTTTGAVVDGNLADAPIRALLGATYSTTGNYLSATPSMFVNPSAGDLHLVVNSATLANVINQATGEANDPNDWNGNSRTVGGPTDVGADDSQSSSSPSLVVGGVASPSSLATATNSAAIVSLVTNSDTTAHALRSTSTSGTKSVRTAGGPKSAPRQVIAGPLALSQFKGRQTLYGTRVKPPRSLLDLWSNGS